MTQSGSNPRNCHVECLTARTPWRKEPCDPRSKPPHLMAVTGNGLPMRTVSRALISLGVLASVVLLPLPETAHHSVATELIVGAASHATGGVTRTAADPTTASGPSRSSRPAQPTARRAVTKQPLADPLATLPVNPLFGVAMPGLPGNVNGVVGLSKALGAVPGTMMWFSQWSSEPDFPAAAADKVTALHAVPEITWEPWNAKGGVDQPTYSLASIISGAHDSYIQRWAQEIAAWGHPLRLRFAQEMNGNWYPWGEGVNGNSPYAYVAAWRHVHDIFAAAGANNVVWVWSPNTAYTGGAPLQETYPGDAYVNEIALDGYNWGPVNRWTGWQSFSSIFAPTLATVATFSKLPISIGEVASNDVGGNKATWVKDMFATLASWPQVKGFVYFDFVKQANWTIDNGAGSEAAFRNGLAQYGIKIKRRTPSA
jgi:hypothetical protein